MLFPDTSSRRLNAGGRCRHRHTSVRHRGAVALAGIVLAAEVFVLGLHSVHADQQAAARHEVLELSRQIGIMQRSGIPVKTYALPSLSSSAPGVWRWPIRVGAQGRPENPFGGVLGVGPVPSHFHYDPPDIYRPAGPVYSWASMIHIAIVSVFSRESRALARPVTIT